MTRTAELIAQELIELRDFFSEDPRFLRLLDLAKETTAAAKMTDWLTFIGTGHP